jgi:signal transduction histidine kinase
VSLFALSSRFRGSIRTQLIVWNVVALSILLLVLGIVVRLTVESYMTRSIDAELENRVKLMRPPLMRMDAMRHPDSFPPPNNFAGGLPFGDIPLNAPPTPRRGKPFRADDPYRPHHFRLDGSSIIIDDKRAMLDKEAFEKAAILGEKQTSSVIIDDEQVRVLTLPNIRRGQIEDIVQVGYPLTERNRALIGLNWALLLLSPFALLSAGLGGAYLTNQVLRRVRLLTEAARQMSARSLSERLPAQGNDEFSSLATAFNSLLGQLETAFRTQENLLEQQKRFTADASHELKTPLTVIKGTAGMVLSGARSPEEYRQSLKDINRASDQMHVLVQDLLYVARSDAGQLGRETTEILVREILELARAAIAPKGGASITLQIEDESLSVEGNQGELTRLFINLMDNAVQYTPQEGQITVSAERSGGKILIAVADTGIGIAPEHLPHLGERFYRVDTSRTRPTGGTGLGLAICKGIVEAHGGSIEWKSQVGVGTTACVTLPAAN